MIKRFSRGFQRYLPAGTPIIPFLFILFALPTALFMALAVPVGQVPDEAAHIARAGSLLHGQLLGQREPRLDGAGHPIQGAGVTLDPGPVYADFAFNFGDPKKMTAANVARLEAIPWPTHRIFIGSPNTAVYFPIFYVPGAFALGAGHYLQYSPYVAVLLGRVVNALTCLVIGVLALRLARRGRLLLLATMSLPMSLALIGSFNEDGVLIATTALIAALLTRAVGPRGVDYWVAALLLACVIAVKPPYLPMAVVMLLPCTAWNRRELLPAVGAMALATLPAVAWALVTLSFVATPFIFGPPYHPGPLWPGDPHRLFPGSDTRAQLDVFFHDPWLLIHLPVQTLKLLWWVELQGTVGLLGLLDVGLASPVYTGWFVAMIAAALGSVFASREEGPGPRLSFVLIALVGVVATIFAIFDLEYLSWTKVGQTLIDGVQGRYALPLLALLAISLPVIRMRGARAIRALLILPTVAMAGFGIVYLPQLVLSTYYLR
jgi:hypothetical protein